MKRKHKKVGKEFMEFILKNPSPLCVEYFDQKEFQFSLHKNVEKVKSQLDALVITLL